MDCSLLQTVGQGALLVDVTNVRGAGLVPAEADAMEVKVGSLAVVDGAIDAVDANVTPRALHQCSESSDTEWDLDWTFMECGEDADGCDQDGCCSELDEDMSDGDGDVDDSDPQHVSEHAGDIYDLMGRDEASHRRPHPSYMKNQPDLDASARAMSVDWLVGVQMKYHLQTETLFLAVSILDRYLSTKRVLKKDLQLVACTSVFIAAKFEEIHPPEVRDFVHITNRSCQKEDILMMEVRMLTALEFCLCRPTAVQYLQRCKREGDCSGAHASLLQYILELALLDLKMTRFSPWLQGAAASLLSSKVLQLNPVLPSSMANRTKRIEEAVQRCAREMFALLRAAKGTTGEVTRKFLSADFHSVAATTF